MWQNAESANVTTETIPTIVLGGRAITDIVITHHARSRWADRVESEKTGFHDITEFFVEQIKIKFHSDLLQK